MQVGPETASNKRTRSPPKEAQMGAASQAAAPPSNAPSDEATNHRRRPPAWLGARALPVLVALLAAAGRAAAGSNLRFDAQTSAYQGLTFTFDPRLDKQVEQRLHFDHWLSIMQQSSSLLYESLNGRAHLAEVVVLIPFKWRQLSAELRPVLYKPGAPVITNRRLRFTDSDVIVGFEDPVYKETPFALQHDECGRPGLHIRMPISFLDQQQQQQPAQQAAKPAGGQLDSRLKARQFVREFASLRYGVFKESGFRADFMYPPFSSVAGLGPHDGAHAPVGARWPRPANESAGDEPPSAGAGLRGFDANFDECKFDTAPASGLPANAQAATCLPYLVRADKALGSFNLMSADPFSLAAGPPGAASWPVQWDELAEQTKWHFCGENFASNYSPALAPAQLEQPAHVKLVHYEHNQRAANKQNKMCQERSALEVIRASEDFRNQQQQSSPANFNRLPTPNFKFLQEMPPRIVMCIEYTAHLFQSRRSDHAILEAAINKFLALDLIAESELATVVFGQHQARQLDRASFERLLAPELGLKSRFTSFTQAMDPFDEPLQYFSPAELAQLDVQAGAAQQQQPVRVLKGSCSFAKLMAEAGALLQKSSAQYDDVGADLVVLTGGLFVEDEARIEEIVRASSFRPEHNRLDLVLYPASALFDTKSREGLVVLDSGESEQVIRARVNKLLLVQRLTGARLHLVRDQLDSSGDVRMSTLVQFYQVFDQLARGHSWDQTDAMVMLQSQQVESRQHQAAAAGAPAPHRLTFQFSLDESVQNELIVGFIDPKHPAGPGEPRHPSQPGPKANKRFALRDLQLRSPGGQLVFTETNTTWAAAAFNQSFADEQLALDSQKSQESAFFPHRAPLSLAAFHVRPAHLGQLGAVRKLAGTWTLSALSDEPVQTSGLAMARVNPQGDTLAGNCWVQTYSQESAFEPQTDEQLRMVKVFVQTTGGSVQQRQELEARMEVRDEMGNIVQNVQMLDDGLGAPDMTQNDGLHSQFVQRATRPGFYRVSVELTVGGAGARAGKLPVLSGQSGQDNVCCGSFMPNPSEPAHPAAFRGKASRQLYCGTFFVEAKNKLAHQRPPRVNNLTVVNVDQDNRRVTLRWFEPQLDINSNSRLGAPAGLRADGGQLVAIMSETDLLGEEDQTSQPARRSLRSTRLTPVEGGPRRRQAQPDSSEAEMNALDEQPAASVLGSNVLMASHQQRSAVPLADQIERAQPLQSRYEIKVFFDRDMVKRAFDAKHDVGFKFNEWSVEGQFPNASQFGGPKEVTLRVPFSREGFYFIAMKVVNNAGLASHTSNIVQFYLRNNMTLEEVESIYGQPGMTVDAEGNIYDKNGDLVQRGGPANQLSSYSLLRGAGALDGLSMLILVSVLTFMMVILCITLVACLASSARHSLKTSAANKASRPGHGSEPKKTLGSIVGLASAGPASAGSGSSMVSSGGCESSEVGACSGSSSLAGSCTGHQGQEHQAQAGSLFFEDLQQSQATSYKLQQQHRTQQQQAQLIHQQLISGKSALKSAQQEFYSQPQPQQQPQPQPQQFYQGPNHKIVNGYTYATVMPATQQDQYQQQQYAGGDLNQNGLVQQQQQPLDAGGIPTSSAVIHPVQSWPADILLSHYDKVKQARERNEAPPVMRIETLEGGNGLQYSDGLPAVFADQQHAADQYGTLREQQASYYNQQLHQQLSSVLKSKRQNLDYDTAEFAASSPALEGLTGELAAAGEGAMPPPPHYLYCPVQAGLPADANGLGGGQLTDPSIYSQTTNLQQVGPADQLAGYYANQQWAPGATSLQAPPYGPQRQSGSLASSGIYSASNVDQAQAGDAAISEV